MLSDTLPSILHHNTLLFPPKCWFSPLRSLSVPVLFPCTTTLMQTKLNGAGKAHSGIVRLKLQLGWELERVPPQTALPLPCTHNRHYYNYNCRRRPPRFVFSIVFKYHSLTTTRQSTAKHWMSQRGTSHHPDNGCLSSEVIDSHVQ